MLVLEGNSRNCSVLQMGLSKLVFWSPRSSPSSYQRCSTWLSETWGWHLHTVQTDADLLNVARTLQSEDQDYSDTDERAAIRV